MFEIATKSGAAPASDAGTRSADDWMSADSPRPRTLRLAILDPLEKLLGELQIAHGPLGADVVEKRGLAVAGSLGQAHVARHERAEDARAEVLARIARDLLREIVAGIEHGQNDP